MVVQSTIDTHRDKDSVTKIKSLCVLPSEISSGTRKSCGGWWNCDRLPRQSLQDAHKSLYWIEATPPNRCYM